MRIQIKYSYGLFVLFICTAFSMHAQQSKGNLPGQVGKGKWMISHNIFSIGYYNEKNKNYDGNDNLIGRDKSGKFYSSVSLFSPNWGNLSFGGGKTHRYDANNIELENVKNSNWGVGLSPSIGCFIQDRLLLGAQVQLYFSRDKTTYSTANGFQEYDYRYTTFGIGPELRYYFGESTKKRLFHAGLATNIIYRINRQTGTNFINGSNTTVMNTYRAKQPEYRVEPYLGSSWFVGKHWTFTGSLFYTATSVNSKARATDSNGLSQNRTKTNRRDMGIRAGVNYTF